MDGDIYERVVRHARRVCPADPAIDGEDVAHSAWLKVATLLPTLPSDLDRLRLMTRAVNQVAIDHHRRGQRHPVLPLADWHPSGENVEAEALARVELGALVTLVAAGDLFAAAAFALALLGGDGAMAALGCGRGTLGSRVKRFRARGAMRA
jgi:DNA-directed RNA polymerase specialized sigma24 family protein